MKKILSKPFMCILLCLSVLLCGLPAAVFAENTAAGTAESPFLIEDASDLAAFRDAVNAGDTYAGKHVKLNANIALTGEWTAIGNGNRSGSGYNGYAFKGVFDGNDKTISGLTITASNAGNSAIGLFGVVDGGTVKNLNITDVNISGDGDNVGAAVGLAVGGSTIDTITVSGSVAGEDGVGGVVGRMTINGTVSGCVNSATVSGAASGGIVGKAYYTGIDVEMNITNCSNSGTITSTAAGGAGGIVGFSTANVKNCTNTGAITATVADTTVGGIVGWQQMYGEVSGNKNSANISSDSAVTVAGGIVGWINYQYAVDGSAPAYPNYEVVSVSGNTNTGNVSANLSKLGSGGIVGGVYNAAVITGNTNNAQSISGGTFAAGVLGSFQENENNGYYSNQQIDVRGNVTSTLINEITATCTSLVGYNNTDSESAADSFSGINVDPNTVAFVSDQAFGNLQEAIDAAQADTTVYLYKDIDVDAPISITKSITLEGNGNVITYTGTNRAIDMPTSADSKLNVTIKNLTVVASRAERGINYNDDGDLNLNSVTVKGDGTALAPTYAVNFPAKSNGAKVEISHCDLTGHIALNVWGSDMVLNVADSHMVSVDTTTVENYAAVKLNNDGVNAAENSVINITGGSITALDENGEPSIAVSNATANGKINVSDSTVVNGKAVANVAVVRYENGQSYGFDDLQNAIDKAIEDDRPVDLIANVTASEIIIVGGAVTINGNGHTLTSSAGRAINIDTTESVKINDLTIVGTDGCERGINVINQAGTTELNNVSISGQSHYAVHIATSAGAAEVEIKDSSLTGYGALAVYGKGANVSVEDSQLVGINTWEDNGYNDFSTIAVGADDVVIVVIGGKVSAESSEGLAKQYIVGANSGSSKNLKVALDAELETKGTASIVNLDVADEPILEVRDDYADELLAEGFATKATENEGIVAIDNSKKVFVVTYVIGEETVATFNIVEGENVADVPAIPAKEGFTAAWDHDGKNISADTTIKAVYTIKTYTVTFIADGETYKTETVEHGGNITMPDVPAKDGYTAAWDHDGKNITADTTIKAVYTAKTYTITYIVDGETYKTETVEHGANITMPDVPAKDGYTGKWDKEVTNVTGDITITAVYTENSAASPSDPQSPQTGNSTNHSVWFALMFIGSAAIILTIYDRKRKTAV